MDPLLILLLGMSIVIVVVLRFRLHAFLALLCGAAVVAALSPPAGLYYRAVRDQAARIDAVNGAQITTAKPISNQSLPSRFTAVGLSSSAHSVDVLGDVELRLDDPSIAPAASRLQLKSVGGPLPQIAPGDYLILPRDLNAAEQLAATTWPARIADGFGNTCGKIGIIIAMAAIIGKCLLDSGAAARIVQSVRAVMGERNTPLAFAMSGFVIGIPVYFDTVFYLLLPLARAMTLRTGRNYLLYILCIIIGATMAHSLVPPTPGPLLVAAELNINLGTMILAGSVVGLIAVAAGFLYSLWANWRWSVELPDEPGALDAANAQPDSSSLPPLWLSCLPIALPVALLSIGTVMQLDWNLQSAMWDRLKSMWNILGDKHVALGLATLIALLMLVRYRPPGLQTMNSVQTALLSAGNIVLITAAGGAFGHVLRQCGIGDAIQGRFSLGQGANSLLIAAFFITAIVRVAQGSATVAMITAVGIIAPIVQTMELSYHPVYVALAIGCGSKPLPWMNDSGFWVITRMSGMSEAESLRTFSVVLTIMGFVGLLVTLAGATWLPLTAP